MNKNSIAALILIASFIGGAVYFSNFLQFPIQQATSSIQGAFLNTTESFRNTIKYHFDQKKTIQLLERKNLHYEKELFRLHQIANEYQKLLALEKSTLDTNASVELVRATSYVRFGDPYKLWIEMKNYDPTFVRGLLFKGYTAGIVVPIEGKPMALLNGDIKSSYAVTVGGSQAPGIVRGKNERRLVVEFIPTWIPISVGDEVITSGLDNIFLSGMKVGKVVSITKASGYQSAVVEPYFYGKNPTYFHLVTKVR